MSVLVTGATGFIGRHLARLLLARGESVRVLVRRPESAALLAEKGAEVVVGDLVRPESAAAAVAGCRVVYHLAAAYSTRPEDIDRMYQVNVRGTLNLLLAARDAGVERIVHTSTVGTIGRPPDGSIPDESVPFNLWDASHYVRSKFFGELIARTMADAGLPVVIVHPTACVGPEDVAPSATGRRLLAFLRGRWLPYPEGGVNFVPVADVVQGMVAAAERGRVGGRYILGHAEGNLDERAYLALMERISGQPPPARPRTGLWARLRGRTDRPRHLPQALTADPTLAIRELGMPQSDLERAFSQAIAWFRSHGYVERKRGS
ncbi:MAG: NAD-dependent epimerase/dehydratase family protein [Chloroflexi bacterium]|nr:NAD-dependent epimerase/dehydratase family protein [Chloroflexota bacterium]